MQSSTIVGVANFWTINQISIEHGFWHMDKSLFRVDCKVEKPRQASIQEIYVFVCERVRIE